MYADGEHTSRMPDFCVALLRFLHSDAAAALYTLASNVQVDRVDCDGLVGIAEQRRRVDCVELVQWLPINVHLRRRATSTDCWRDTTLLPASLRLISVLHTHVLS